MTDKKHVSDDDAAKAISGREEVGGTVGSEADAAPIVPIGDVADAYSDKDAPQDHDAVDAPAQGKGQSDEPGGTLGPAPEEESVSPPPEAGPAKRSPADAFMDLTTAVRGLRGDVDEVGSFVRKCKDMLLRQADEYRFEGMQAVLASMMRLHELIFRQVISMEAGNTRPDAFTINLFETIEAELETHGVEIIRPHPGDEINLEVMTTIGTASCPFWRKPGKVAQVFSCGFFSGTDSSRRVLRKAEVTVYRR